MRAGRVNFTVLRCLLNLLFMIHIKGSVRIYRLKVLFRVKGRRVTTTWAFCVRSNKSFLTNRSTNGLRTRQVINRYAMRIIRIPKVPRRCCMTNIASFHPRTFRRVICNRALCVWWNRGSANNMYSLPRQRVRAICCPGSNNYRRYLSTRNMGYTPRGIITMKRPIRRCEQSRVRYK